MIILDTNVISELMKPQGSTIVYQWVAVQPIKQLFTTTITQAEILYGIALLPIGKRQKQLTKIAQKMFTEDFEDRILAFDQQAAICFAKIASQRRQKGIPISQADAQIAAICAAKQATLATRNVTDFRDCEIVIINPWGN
ncbi:type II toxin-antitoxin system VapC family toxin [Cyanothece sp. BG0011]|uniref:type II toxin-antitoxin system VapC family toxin n=1 Tax=Cyanothece sp. BG0011 TaxID=2082950 RepID=UPI000D1E9107|nr:type II toxin-antitoxin system VapC family toxin [Cyanothece sp. BG0011]